MAQECVQRHLVDGMSPGIFCQAHLCVWVVAAPVRPDAGLAPQVPHLELDVLVRHRLHIESNGCKLECSVTGSRKHLYELTGVLLLITDCWANVLLY